MSSHHVEHEEVENGDISNKRKRDPEDNGDREQKKVHVEDSMIGIEALHQEVGSKYLFLQNPHPPQNPNAATDLFALYGLESLSVSVERFKPNGEKSVKMRKTYKNKVKEHGISGNFDSIKFKKEATAPDGMFMMMQMPQEQWDGEITRGKDIEKGLASVIPLMGNAFRMSKGSIPKNRWDSTVLGEVAAPAPKTQAVKPNGAKTPMPSSGVHSVPRQKSELPRPKRNVKKRTYGDSSYEGYGEGYVDDDAHETGYSTNDGDERGMGRKRPKKTAQGHFQGPLPRQNSYGPGMVGA